MLASVFCRSRAAHLGGFAFGASGAAWYLLHALGIPKLLWVTYPTPFQGNLPTTEEQLSYLMSYIRRQGHLFERGGAADVGLNSSKQSAFVSSEPAQADPLATSDPWQGASLGVAPPPSVPTPQPNGHVEDPWSTYQFETPAGAAHDQDEVSTSGTEDGDSVPFEELAEYYNMPPEEAEAQLRHAYLMKKRFVEGVLR